MNKKGNWFIIIFVLIVSLMSFDANAASWSYKWTNTVITVPLGAELGNYIELPKAYLYRDDELLKDAEITYLRDGDWLYYLDDVNTNRVGSYNVWYKAFERKYSPGTCKDYKALIRFDVVDDEAPIINIIKDKVVVKRGTNYDIKSNVVVTDNSKGDIVVDYITSFDPNIISDYPVTVKAFDGTNYSVSEFVISVVDFSKPELTYIGPAGGINVPLNGSIDLSQYFYAYDSVDGVLTDRIIFPFIDTKNLGSSRYEAVVKNDASTMASCEFRVNVVDDVAPEIRILNTNLVLDYKTDLVIIDFKKYITIIDNSPINYDNLIISTDAVNAVGDYVVEYSYFDGSFTATAAIDLKLVSKDKPQIYTETITINVGEDFDYLDYISVVDDSDDLIYDSLVIQDENVDFTKGGVYFIPVSVVNSSGLSADKKLKLVINEPKKSFLALENLLPMGLGLLLGVVFFVAFFLVKKYKNKRTN